MSTEVRLLISWLLGYSESDNIQVVLVVPLCLQGPRKRISVTNEDEIVYDLDGSLADGDKE